MYLTVGGSARPPVGMGRKCTGRPFTRTVSRPQGSRSTPPPPSRPVNKHLPLIPFVNAEGNEKYAVKINFIIKCTVISNYPFKSTRSHAAHKSTRIGTESAHCNVGGYCMCRESGRTLYSFLTTVIFTSLKLHVIKKLLKQKNSRYFGFSFILHTVSAGMKR